jgi:hypothetical protein
MMQFTRTSAEYANSLAPLRVSFSDRAYDYAETGFLRNYSFGDVTLHKARFLLRSALFYPYCCHTAAMPLADCRFAFSRE